MRLQDLLRDFMKLTNPLPQPLPKEFGSFVDNGNNGLDGVIPRTILENAKGFAIFTIIKAGFVLSARAGSGIVIAKLDDGTWSAPSAIGTAGLGLGSQAGAEMTDFLVVLNSRSAIRSFMAAGSLTLGGNMSIALGPLGRTGEASGAVNTNGRVAAMYSYSKTRGLFGGLSVEGSVIVERQDANVQAYNSPVTAKMLLGGTVEPPEWAEPLIKTLNSCTGMPGTRDWVNDEGNRTPGGSYIFGGGLSSPDRSGSNTPSFLRKKRKPDPFPPASWSSESNDTGSYFTNTAPQAHSRNMTWDGGNTSTANNLNAKFDSAYGSETKAATNTRPHYTWNASPSSYSSKNSMNPFAAAHTSSDSSDIYGSLSGSSPSPMLSQVHQRAMSANFKNNRTAFDIQEESVDLFSPKPTVQRTNSMSSKPFIKSRDELSRPLLPHEGVARAIAVFDFNAVEGGDLSFKKGDIITITKKSNSVDDWWTGKIDGRQGIFPANFVEIA